MHAQLLLQQRYYDNIYACRNILRQQREAERLKVRRQRVTTPRRADPSRICHLTALPPHRRPGGASPPPRPPFFNPPVDLAVERRTEDDDTLRPTAQQVLDGKTRSPATSPRTSPRVRPRSAHATTNAREWRHAARSKLPISRSVDRVHTTFDEIVTDTPWTEAHPVPTLFNPRAPERHTMTHRPPSPSNSYGERRPFSMASTPAGVSIRKSHMPQPRAARVGAVTQKSEV